MKALFVAWQNPSTRSWTAVGRLTRNADGMYEFVYTKGAESEKFNPFGRMVSLDKGYLSPTLFPLFANRVLPKNRPEYSDYMSWLGLTANSGDALEELGRTGGRRETDSLELIPCPGQNSDGAYEIFFFCRGLRHLPTAASVRASKLSEGEHLYLLRDMQNAHDDLALLMRTGEPVTLVGYMPRYHAADVCELFKKVQPSDVKVIVERVNLDAPVQYRLLCRLLAPWPEGFSPCSSRQFEPIESKSVSFFLDTDDSKRTS